MAAEWEIGLLGPVRVVVDGRPRGVGAQRRRTALAALAMVPGRTVSAETLAEHLWGDSPPHVVRRAVSTTMTRLRADLGIDVIGGGPDGYTLTVPAHTVDVYRFRALMSQARQARAAGATELELLDRALACWRGEPLQDIQSARLRAQHVPGLTEEWFAAAERRFDLLLSAGVDADLVPQLRDLTAQHPLREPLWCRLMVALCRAGRQAEALEAYQSVREVLVNRLGVDPGRELRAAHRAVLTGDPGFAGGPMLTSGPALAGAWA